MNLTDLLYGDTGESVQILQEKLQILGFYSGIITGSFGNNTQLAVIRFQQSYDLETNGIVNQEVWKTLFSATEPIFFRQLKNTPKTIRLGDDGNDVEKLQEQLKLLMYYNDEINGHFDTDLQKSVKEFQLMNKLTADGVVGTNTWNALSYLYAPLNNCPDIEPVNPNEPDIPSDDNYYIVAKGDTLWSIANKFGVSVNELRLWNNLNSDLLSIGQQLLIKSQNTENNYIVKRGDTLYSIATRFHTTVDELKRLNQLSTDNLAINQVLKVPNDQSNVPQEEFDLYTVKKGDTLYKIANYYHTNVNTLKQINHLTSDKLAINQILKVPKTTNLLKTDDSSHYISYTVVKGDTLYKLAREFDTTVEHIKAINNLLSNTLTIGQILLLPDTSVL